ncbi:hypothetical protein MMPV_002808 [Pyropia vietnamensis]
MSPPSTKHQGDGPMSCVNSLVNDFGSFSMKGAVAPEQPQPSPQPAAASMPPTSSGVEAAATGGESPQIGMTATSSGVAMAPVAAAGGTMTPAVTASAGTTAEAGTIAATGPAGTSTSAAWAGSAMSPAAGNTQPVGVADRCELVGLSSSHAGVPNGVIGVPNRAAGLPSGFGAANHSRVASGSVPAADARAYGASTQPRETMLEMWVPLAAVGSVIGSHGTVIKSLQAKSGATIVVHNEVFDTTASSKMITINGRREAVTMAKMLVEEVVARPRGGSGGGSGGGYVSGGGGGRGGSFSQSLSVPADTLTAPDRLRQISAQTGAKLVVTGPVARPSGASGTGGAVATAAGAPTEASAVADARGTTAPAESDQPINPPMVQVQITGRQHAVRSAASMLDGHSRPGGGGPGTCVVSASGASSSRSGGGSGGGGEGVTDRSLTGTPRRGGSAAADGVTGGGSPVCETIGVRNDKVGLLIGRGGVHVQNIQDRSGASVQVQKDTNAPVIGSNGAGPAGAGSMTTGAVGGRAGTPAAAVVATNGSPSTAAGDTVPAAAGGTPAAVATGGTPPPALPPLAPPVLRAVTITGTRGAVELAKSLISERVGGIHPPPPGTAVPTSHPHHYHGPHHHGHHGHHHPHRGYHGALPPSAAAPPHLGPAAFQHHVAVAAVASATAGGGASPPRGVPPGIAAGALGANGVGSPPPAVAGSGPAGALGPPVGVSHLPVLLPQSPYTYPFPSYMYPAQGVPPGHVRPPSVYGSPPYDAGMYPGSPGGTAASGAAAVPGNSIDQHRMYYMAYQQQQIYARQQQAAAAAAAAAATAGAPRQGGLPAAGVPPTAMYGYGVLSTASPVAVGVTQPAPDGGQQAVEDAPVA